jgi:hypothetical protein
MVNVTSAPVSLGEWLSLARCADGENYAVGRVSEEATQPVSVIS